MKHCIIGRAKVTTHKLSRRYYSIQTIGTGVRGRARVHAHDLNATFAHVCEQVRRDANRPGGTKNWVQGFKGRAILGNTTGIAGRAPNCGRVRHCDLGNL